MHAINFWRERVLTEAVSFASVARGHFLNWSDAFEKPLPPPTPLLTLYAVSRFLPVSVTDAAASTVFQTMLTVCHRKRPKLCKQLLGGIMEYLSSRNAAPGVR